MMVNGGAFPWESAEGSLFKLDSYKEPTPLWAGDDVVKAAKNSGEITRSFISRAFDEDQSGTKVLSTNKKRIELVKFIVGTVLVFVSAAEVNCVDLILPQKHAFIVNLFVPNVTNTFIVGLVIWLGQRVILGYEEQERCAKDVAREVGRMFRSILRHVEGLPIFCRATNSFII